MLEDGINVLTSNSINQEFVALRDGGKMKRYWKKIVTLTVSAAMAGAVLAGCSQDTKSTSQMENPPVEKESDTLSAKAEFGSSPSGEVTIWGWDETEILKEHLAEIYPDVTINYVTIAQADLPQKIQTTLASGAQMPDKSPKGSWPVIRRMMEGKRIIVPGDGSSLWTITFNEDFARGFIGLMGNTHAIGEAVHITTDEVLTWDQMAQAVADALHVEYKPYYITTDVLVELNPELAGGLNGDKRHSVIYDNTKLKQLVPGFAASIPWRVGVQRALSRILSCADLRPEDPEFDRWCDDLIMVYDEALERAKEKCCSR